MHSCVFFIASFNCLKKLCFFLIFYLELRKTVMVNITYRRKNAGGEFKDFQRLMCVKTIRGTSNDNRFNYDYCCNRWVFFGCYRVFNIPIQPYRARTWFFRFSADLARINELLKATGEPPFLKRSRTLLVRGY